MADILGMGAVVPDRDPTGVSGHASPQVIQFVGSPGSQLPASAQRESSEDPQPAEEPGRLALTALMALPGVLVVFMGFNAGGYFPGTPAIGAVVLAQILLVRIVRAPRPFEGFAPATLVAIAALGSYTLMTLVSALWSHSTARALIEFDRAWFYLLILLLFGAIRPSTQDLRWFLRGLLLGVSIVCVAGLVTRLLPDVWHTAPNVSNQRLSYPVTYWNTLGLLGALGIVLALHLSSTLAERRSVQAVAAAVLPLLAATLFFTFSRGAMAAGAIGLVLYVIVARPRGLVSGVLASAPATAVLIVVAYKANLLDTTDPTTPAAVAQGHGVALVAGICVVLCAGLRLLLAIVLDRSLRGSPSRRFMRAHRKRATVLLIAVGVLVASLALGLPHALSGDWNRFISGAATHGSGGDLRQRLSDPSNDGRTDLWQVALHGFSSSELHGHGAGTYQTLWDRHRSHFAYVINAHSLYLQAMAELGLPGLLFLVMLLGAVLGGLATRARADRSRRTAFGALLALCAVWALRAGVDWDWEMPVLTLCFFAAAGLGLSPRQQDSAGWLPSQGVRVTLAALCLASVVLPVLIVGSQRQLDSAEQALYASDCASASSASLSSIGWLDVRPEPYEILGFCDIARGLPREGIAAMRQAVRLDPGSWETYYALALAQASAGIDPRANAKRALEMNPLEALTRQAARELDSSSPAEWVRRAAIVRASALASKDLSIVPS